jgi:methyl-accepting chemotaxis protein
MMRITPAKELDSTIIVDPLLDIRTKADKIMCAILGVHLIYCLGLAQFYDTYTAFFMVGLPIGGAAMLLTWLRPGRVLTRMVAAATLMVLTALAIHQAHGMIEMHFGFFALLAMLLFYRDWMVYIPATLVAAVHHISFNYLQEMDFGVFCFTKTGWGVVAVHVGYVVFEVTILVYMAEMMRRESIKADTLLRTSNDANNVLTALASRVRNVAGQFGTSAEQVAAGNNELSLRAEQQASTLEETAASMQQLTAAVKLNADNARQANALAAGASSVAIKGGQAVDEVVQTMNGIEASSRKIADIISVIDSIAFQTNILALNAAVEAARAGEQGRGFAVVASEVRSLAARSAEAAKEIKSLIGDSVIKVDAGGKLVEDAGKTMAEIVSAVKQVTDIIGQITTSSHEQSVGIEQVNHAVMSLEQATQQNVAVVEETSAAAESMREQAADLLETVSNFNAQDGVQWAQTAPKNSTINANHAKTLTKTKISTNLKVGFSR